MADPIRIEGLQQLERNLNALPEQMAKRVLAKAAKAAGALLKAAAIAKARENFTARTGRLFRGIRHRFHIKGQDLRGAVVYYTVGLTTRGKESPFYGRFLEQGWRAIGRGKKQRSLLRRGKIAGNRIAARPFFKPAFEEAAPKALEKFLAVAREEVAKLFPQT
jgi:HK97 gp10 family phage protein